MGDRRGIKLKRGLLLLCSLAAVGGIGIGVYFRYERIRSIDSALPPQVQILLDKGQKFFLYSLQPERLPEADLKTMPNFHGYPIVGQTPVKASPQRADLLAAMRTGLGKKTNLDCFEPKYGIRVVRRKKTVDLLIAFDCEKMEVYDERGRHKTTVDASAKQVFNRILAELDVPLPEK